MIEFYDVLVARSARKAELRTTLLENLRRDHLLRGLDGAGVPAGEASGLSGGGEAAADPRNLCLVWIRIHLGRRLEICPWRYG